jgi:hypothetical protein
MEHEEMSSIYQRALAADFEKLHPKIQERFGFSSEDQLASIGEGTMEKLWRGKFFTLPFLYIGTWRHIMFPERGQDVPFTIENFAYKDSFGRETVTWVRTFKGSRVRRFDATMIYSEKRNRIVDYLGTHQHLAVDIDIAVDPKTKGVRIRSGEQRFYEGKLGFIFPMAFSGIAEVCEWYDDATDRYRIEVRVTNKRWGPLFGYSGSFDVRWLRGEDAGPPKHVLPLREEARE